MDTTETEPRRPRRSRLSAGRALGLALCAGVMAVDASAAQSLPGRVISVLRSFEPGEDERWLGGPSGGSAEANQVDGVRTYSRDTPFGTRCLKLDVTNPVPFSGWKKAGWDQIDKIFLVGLLKIPHFPPEADVVRLRCRVLQGRFQLSVGGPVIQSGTSDVFADPVELTAENCGEWRTVDLSLNHRLLRNFRRARYSKESPVIYQTRWGQEDFCVVGFNPSAGIILLDQIELVSIGEGRPFPRFAPGAIRTVRRIADFESESELRKVSTVLHGYDGGQGQEDTFIQSWKREPDLPGAARWSDKSRKRLVHEPVKLRLADGGANTGRLLAASARFAEEHSFALIKTEGEPNANALEVVIKASGRNGDLRLHSRNHWGMAIDFLVLVAPENRPLPWTALAASDDLRRGPGPGFDYELSLKRTQGISYGYYHARRLLTEDAWTTLVIPFADFVCGYGQGDLEKSFRRQLPLQGSQIAGVMFTGPIRFDMEILIDAISYVRVPGNPDSLRSYWQVPEISAIRLEKHPWLRSDGVQVLPAMR